MSATASHPASQPASQPTSQQPANSQPASTSTVIPLQIGISLYGGLYGVCTNYSDAGHRQRVLQASRKWSAASIKKLQAGVYRTILPALAANADEARVLATAFDRSNRGSPGAAATTVAWIEGRSARFAPAWQRLWAAVLDDLYASCLLSGGERAALLKGEGEVVLHSAEAARRLNFFAHSLNDGKIRPSHGVLQAPMITVMVPVYGEPITLQLPLKEGEAAPPAEAGRRAGKRLTPLEMDFLKVSSKCSVRDVACDTFSFTYYSLTHLLTYSLLTSSRVCSSRSGKNSPRGSRARPTPTQTGNARPRARSVSWRRAGGRASGGSPSHARSMACSRTTRRSRCCSTTRCRARARRRARRWRAPSFAASRRCRSTPALTLRSSPTSSASCSATKVRCAWHTSRTWRFARRGRGRGQACRWRWWGWGWGHPHPHPHRGRTTRA